MDSVVSYDKLHDEVDLIERNSMNNFYAKRFVNGKLTIKQILIGLFVVLVIEKCSSSSLQVISLIKDGMEEKRQFVREIMLDSWNAYERYAWGYDELMPVSKKDYSDTHFNESLYGLTLVTSMSTLWTMGLKEQFEKGKKWIETKLDLQKWNSVPVYDVIVNYVGGLLSCYAQTRDRMFLDKAKEFDQLVEPAFNRSKGMPYQFINSRYTIRIGGDNFHHTSGLQLDLNYLSDASEDVNFRNYVAEIQEFHKASAESNNHYLNWIADKYPPYSNGASYFTDSCEMFSSLVKAYIQSNYRTEQSLKMYNDALNAVKGMNMFDIFPNGLHYTRGYDNEDSRTHDTFMQYSSCCAGSMLSMGANALSKDLYNSVDQSALSNNQSYHYSKLFQEQQICNEHLMAKQITETCQRASNETATGLAPHKFYYDNETQHVVKGEEYYHLSHELAESNFILWRLTHQSAYRENAWQMAQAIHKHCRVESGLYSGVMNVNQVPTKHNDHQPSIFLSATLKYLYLTFTDDTVLPLDQFVFNSVGHPLPICGNHTMYPADMCKY